MERSHKEIRRTRRRRRRRRRRSGIKFRERRNSWR